MFRLFLVFVVAFHFASATDFCSPALCNGEASHIACRHNGKFASICPADAAMVTLTPELKSVLLNAHNTKRNLIAGGGDPKHEKACRMATMQWDDELASVAAFNVKQCQMNHDKCRNTDAFKFSGQNLAWMGYTEPVNHQSMLQQAVQMWYDEVKDSNMNIIRKFPNNFNGPAIGHFTVMMADRNIRMGCAASTYSEAGQSFKTYLLACNYATTNMINFPIYASCSTAASQCKTGTNPAFPNLCSTNEIYDVNKWF